VKIRIFVLTAILVVILVPWGKAQTDDQADALPAPGFHHLHLNLVNPDGAIDIYTKQFPSMTKATVAGFPN
jgi:hypothetical protein